MAKTYRLIRKLQDEKRGLVDHDKPVGCTVSREFAMKYPNNVKLVETKYPVDENSFDFTPEEAEEKKLAVEDAENSLNPKHEKKLDLKKSSGRSKKSDKGE